jgi:GPH family glycoside/pentoside/hexuronide:cation symporter
MRRRARIGTGRTYVSTLETTTSAQLRAQAGTARTEGAASTSAGAPPPLTLRVKLLYGLGTAATGIKTRAFASFLMIYCNQVLGLTPASVSMIIMIATMVDAVVDPVVGQVSDSFRSRWGRRHPFMYVAILPTAAAFFFIWAPPDGMSADQLFYFLLLCLIIVRIFDTFFELPATALVPELTADYNERTTLMSMRKGFEMVAGLLMALAGYQIFMREDENGGGGLIGHEGYFGFGLTATLLILVSMLISALGTHHRIPWLRQPPAREARLLVILKEMVGTLNNRTFLTIAVAGMLYATCLGIRQALEIYFFLYFWELSQAQIALLTTISVPASLIGVCAAPFVSSIFGKRKGTLACWLPALLINITPIVLRLAGLLPGNDSDWIFYLLLAENFAVQALLITAGVLVPSMIADVVEDSEVKTGRRAEGLLFASDNLFRKMISGVGVFVSGLVLTAAAFPQNAQRGTVDAAVLHDMALLYLPVYVAFFVGAMGAVSLFGINREIHEENLRTLEARASARSRPD